MDMPRSDVRPVEFDTFSTPKHLEHASEQARKRNYQDFLIVDVDSHHYESESYARGVRVHRKPGHAPRRHRTAARRAFGWLNGQVGYQDMAAASRATGCASTRSRAPPSIATSA
jgi:uncharacterized protein